MALETLLKRLSTVEKACFAGGLLAGGFIGWQTGDYIVAHYMSDAPILVRGAMELLPTAVGAVIGGNIGGYSGIWIEGKRREYRARQS